MVFMAGKMEQNGTLPNGLRVNLKGIPAQDLRRVLIAGETCAVQLDTILFVNYKFDYIKEAS